MKRCTGCQRHLLVPEPRCPFCGASQAPLPRGPRVGLALVLGLSTASCTEPGEPMTNNSGSSTAVADSSTSSSSISATSMGTVVDTGSGSATTQATGSSSTTDASGNSFVEYGGGDGGTSIFECDLWAQDCPEGEKCMPWANDGGTVHNATRCSPIDNDPDETAAACSVEGNGYSGIDSCDLRAMCFGVNDETNEGHCVAMCGGDEASPMCDEPGAECAFVFELPLPFCLVTCDPLASMCAEGHTCAPLEDRFACVPQTEVPMGESCDAFNECDAGSVCVESMTACGGGSCCVSVCDTSDPGADALCMAEGTSSACTPWFDPEVMSNVGACVDP